MPWTRSRSAARTRPSGNSPLRPGARHTGRWRERPRSGGSWVRLTPGIDLGAEHSAQLRLVRHAIAQLVEGILDHLRPGPIARDRGIHIGEVAEGHALGNDCTEIGRAHVRTPDT